jgi:hypothetical protein
MCELQTRHIMIALSQLEQLLRAHIEGCPHCSTVVKPCAAAHLCCKIGAAPSASTASASGGGDEFNTTVRDMSQREVRSSIDCEVVRGTFNSNCVHVCHDFKHGVLANAALL